VAFKLRIPQRKPWAGMAADVSAATALLSDPAVVRAGTPPAALEDAQRSAAAAIAGLVRVQAAVDAQDPAVTASRLGAALADVAALEVAQAPGLPFALPRDLGGGAYPILTGRAAVALDIVRPRGGGGPDGGGLAPQSTPRPGEDPATPLARPDGTAARRAGGAGADRATVVLTLDGYSAPLTAGQLAANVGAGVFDGVTLTAGQTAVLAGGGIPADRLPGGHATLPLELLPAGAFDPVYRSPLDVAGGELPVLPLSVYGAVAMARPAAVPAGEASASEFFMFLYSRSQAGLSGLAFEEGEFPVVGYVTEGGDVLPRLRSGDIIKKARLVEGADRLVLPARAPAVAAVDEGGG
jgi:cyclophilin family peptidyl-prolyl cis-trans isomerase